MVGTDAGPLPVISSTTNPRLRVVSVADYFGAGNIGDDLMVEGLVQVLAEAEARGGGPFSLILPCPHRLISQMQRFPNVTWCRLGVGYDVALAEADLMLLPGDTPFMPQAWVWDKVPGRVALGGSRSLLCLAVGAEEPAGRQFPQALTLLQRACFTTARDATSAHVLRTLVPERSDLIAEGADLANIALRQLFRHSGLPTCDRPIPLALLWYAETTSMADTAGVADFVKRRVPNDWPVFLSHECRLAFEYNHFRKLFPRGQPRPRFIRPRYSVAKVDGLVAPYREISTVLASRYHSLLAAAWAGCRIAALPRSLKVVGLARTLDIPMVDTPITADAMERAIRDARTIPRAKLDDLADRALETGVDAVIRVLPPTPQRRIRTEPLQPKSRAPRILVIRQDSIGDAVLTSAMLRELRRSFPDANITLVTTLAVRSLFAHCPCIDHLIPYDFSGWGHPQQRNEAATVFAQNILRPLGFDVALLPRYDLDYWGGRAMIASCGAPVRVGYASGLTEVGRQNRELVEDPFTLTLAPNDVRHEVERNLALVEAIGGKILDRHLELWPLVADRREVASRLAAFCGDARAPLVAVAPGAAHKVKIWPLGRFIAVGRKLAEDLTARIVVVGGKNERDAGAAIAAELGDCAIDLTGQFSLNQTFAVVEACDLLISNDSAPVHLASAAGTPVIVLSPHAREGDANAPMSQQRFGPWMTQHRTLQPARREAPCSETCTALDAHCILEISAEDAINASLELLRRQSPQFASICDNRSSAGSGSASSFPRERVAASGTEGVIAVSHARNQDSTNIVRFWETFAEQNGPDWKESQATSKLRFLLKVLGETTADLEGSRILIVDDGPLQTLARLKAKLRVSIDPCTNALVRSGLLQPEVNDGDTHHLSASITDNLLPEASFDVILVSCPTRNPDHLARLLTSVFRVAAPGARIALNLYGQGPQERLSLVALQTSLGRRKHEQSIALLEQENTIRGWVRLGE